MKRFTRLMIWIIAFPGFLMAQGPEPLLFPENEIIDKGTLYYFDGRRESFSGLQFRKQEVLFADSTGTLQFRPLNEIATIGRRVNQVGKGALMGGAAGFLAGFVAGNLIYGEGILFDTTGEGEDEGRSLRKEEIPLLAGCTFGGMVIGSLIGLTSKKEKIIYRRYLDMEVFPGFSSLPSDQQAFTLNVRVRLH